MIEADYHLEDIKQNLIDAGCTEDFIEQFKQLLQQNDCKGQSKLLIQHKKQLKQVVLTKKNRLTV